MKTVFLKNGDKYIGHLDREEKYSGKGEYIFSNNNKYIGSFLNGKYHGEGSLILDLMEISGKFINGSI
jgi:hypothetical protein